MYIIHIFISSHQNQDRNHLEIIFLGASTTAARHQKKMNCGEMNGHSN